MEASVLTPLIGLIEDDEAQAELIELAITAAGLRARLHCIRDGRAGLMQLRQWMAAAKTGGERPALVVLDIKLPRLSGLEILEALSNENGNLPFPIVMLTSSKMPEDLIDSLGSGAVSYFVKPLGFQELVRLMDTIGRRWLDSPTLTFDISE